MYVNCNLPLPVAEHIVKKYKLPHNSIMTSRELGRIVNPELPIQDLPDDSFNPSFNVINYTSSYMYDWILKSIVKTPYGDIRTGKIINRKNAVPTSGMNELARIYATWYEQELTTTQKKSCSIQ